MLDATTRLGAAATEVVIVGMGPVGAMLANLLGMQSISTLVVEREPHIYDLPRAVHFDDEVMRLLQTVGLAQEMEAMTHPVPGTRFVDDDGRLLLDWSRSSEVGPQGWHVSYRFHQPEFEAVLRQGLARWPSVTVRTGCEVTAIEQDARRVRLFVRDGADGRMEAADARFVVGCDGARSVVKQAIGGRTEDLGFRERWLVVDVLLRRPLPELGEHSLQHCSTVRPATYIRGLGRRRRWEIALFPGEDADAMAEPQVVLRLLRRWVEPDDITLERVAVYTFHSTLAERWRSGRLLLAGDAAHQMPPFLGQGLCSGMRDAANLAWKLSAVLRGHAPDRLLDSYQQERAPHVREYIELSVKLGGLINTKAMAAAVPESTLRGGEPLQMVSIRPRLGPCLGDGSAVSGSLSPQPRLEDGRLLDDRVGFRFALVTGPRLAAEVLAAEVLAAEVLAAEALAVEAGAAEAGAALSSAAHVAVVSDPSPALSAWLEAVGGGAALIRPDRYVAGIANDAEGVLGLLAHAAGINPARPAEAAMQGS